MKLLDLGKFYMFSSNYLTFRLPDFLRFVKNTSIEGKTIYLKMRPNASMGVKGL